MMPSIQFGFTLLCYRPLKLSSCTRPSQLLFSPSSSLVGGSRPYVSSASYLDREQVLSHPLAVETHFRSLELPAEEKPVYKHEEEPMFFPLESSIGCLDQMVERTRDDVVNRSTIWIEMATMK